MWGPKQEMVQKPQVLHFYCWIISMWVSEGIRKKKKWEAKWWMIKGKCIISLTLNVCAFNWAAAWCGKMVFMLRNVKITILYKPVSHLSLLYTLYSSSLLTLSVARVYGALSTSSRVQWSVQYILWLHWIPCWHRTWRSFAWKCQPHGKCWKIVYL